MKRHYEKHRLSDTVEYQAWADMLTRCTNPANKRFKDYGARGITVCERWKLSFLAFLEDVGMRPASGMSLDRVKNNGNYEPGNVRWATSAIQGANRRTSVMLTLEGVTMTVSDWARLKGMCIGTLQSRVQKKYPPELLFVKGGLQGRKNFQVKKSA